MSLFLFGLASGAAGLVLGWVVAMVCIARRRYEDEQP